MATVKVQYNVDCQCENEEAKRSWAITKTEKWPFPFLPQVGQDIFHGGWDFKVTGVPYIFPKEGCFHVNLNGASPKAVLDLVEKHGWTLDTYASGYDDNVEEAMSNLREEVDAGAQIIQATKLR